MTILPPSTAQTFPVMKLVSGAIAQHIESSGLLYELLRRVRIGKIGLDAVEFLVRSPITLL